MRNFLTAVICISLLNMQAFSQAPLVKVWDKRFGGTYEDKFCTFQQTADGGYILGGTSSSGITGDKTEPSRGGYDYWVVKTDPSGNKLWDKRYGGSAEDKLRAIEQTTDGGYIFGGGSESPASGDKTQPRWGTGSWKDYWVVKTDSLGNKQWDKRFGGNGLDDLNALKQTADGGYILAGQSDSDSSGDKTQQGRGLADYWIVKIDALGNKEWDRRYGGSHYDRCFAVQQAPDRGYLLGGFSYSDSSEDKSQHSWDTSQACCLYRGDFWVVKVDSNGNKQWDRRYGGTSIDAVYTVASGDLNPLSLEPTNDGGYILGGYSASAVSGDQTQPGRGGGDYWIVKIDALGNKQWDKRFGGTREDRDGHVYQTLDGGYIVSGNSYSNASGDKSENNPIFQNQVWLVKTDALGNKQWDKTIFTLSNNSYTGEGGFARQCADSGYVVGSYTHNGVGGYKTEPNWDTVNHFSRDYWIVKFRDTTVQLCPVLSLTLNVSVTTPELSTGAIRISVSGGEAPYLYSLDGSTYQSHNTFTSLGIGAYQVHVVDDNGCTVQETFAIDRADCCADD